MDMAPPRTKAGRFFDEGFLARLEQLHLVAKRLATRTSVGTRRSRRLGDGLEFADHRDYASGDDIRFVDWSYYARMDKMLLRLFHQHSQADVVIMLDVSASMAPGGRLGKLNYARRAAAALAYVAMGTLERVVCQPFADGLHRPMRTGRNRGQIFEVLDFLDAIEPGGPTRLSHSVAQLVAGERPKGTVVILSDLMGCGEELSDAIARLRHREYDVVVLHVHAPGDASPQLTGPMLLRDAESRQAISLHVDAQLLGAYRARWRQFAERCEHECLSRGAIYVPAATDVSFETLVLNTLRRAGVLAE